MNQNNNQRPLTPKDALAFVLVGDWDGEAYDGLDEEQLDRMDVLIQTIMENRLILSVDVPPVSESHRRSQAGNN